MNTQIALSDLCLSKWGQFPYVSVQRAKGPETPVYRCSVQLPNGQRFVSSDVGSEYNCSEKCCKLALDSLQMSAKKLLAIGDKTRSRRKRMAGNARCARNSAIVVVAHPDMMPCIDARLCRELPDVHFVQFVASDISRARSQKITAQVANYTYINVRKYNAVVSRQDIVVDVTLRVHALFLEIKADWMGDSLGTGLRNVVVFTPPNTGLERLRVQLSGGCHVVCSEIAMRSLVGRLLNE